MKVQKRALSIAMATAFTLTCSLTACFADSEAGLSASSNASTMNNSQESRETTTQAQTNNETNASTHEQSEARTVNASQGRLEAGGSLNRNYPAPQGVPGSTDKKPMTTSAGTNHSSTSRVSTVSHVPHMQTHTYRWSNTHRSRLASRTYTRTIQQAARTR